MTRPSSGRDLRIVCVSNGPLPYHTPILNELAAAARLEVIYMSHGHPLQSFRDLWGVRPCFPYSFHWSWALTAPRHDFRTQLSVGVGRKLRRLDPDVVLVSSWGPLTWEPLVWARLSGCGAVVWAESTVWSGLTRGRLSNAGRRIVVNMADAFVANGTCAAEFLRHFGVAEERIVASRLPAPPRLMRTEPQDRRSGHPRLLFVGRLIPRKRPLDTIKALSLLDRPEVSLTIVGDGPLEGDVRREAAKLGKRIEIRDRLESGDLDAVYASADLLLVPSEREVWGLVVNEALAHGLFVIASDQVGSAVDVLVESSGSIVQTGNVNAFVAAIQHALDTVDFTPAGREMRRRSVAAVTPERFAGDILAAAALAARSRPRQRRLR